MLVKDDAPERYSSDLYYDFFDGGYLSPQEFLEAEEDIEAVKEARAVIQRYFAALEEAGKLEIG
jgi:hypothetical protein